MVGCSFHVLKALHCVVEASKPRPIKTPHVSQPYPRRTPSSCHHSGIGGKYSPHAAVGVKLTQNTVRRVHLPGVEMCVIAGPTEAPG